MTTLRILIVCFTGAFIGGLIGLQFGHPVVGLIAGSLFSYLAYDFNAARASAVTVYRMITVEYKAKLKEKYPNALRQVSGFLRQVGDLVVSYIYCTISALVLMILHVAAVSVSLEGFTVLERLHTWQLYAAMGFSAFFSLIAVGNFFFTDEGSLKAVPNPGRGILLVFKYEFTLLAFVLSQAWLLIGLILKGLKTFFVLIHSDLRLLCACDTALGTLIGYFSGDALIGAITGGILGVINYEIVSIKVLKLTPASRA